MSCTFLSFIQYCIFMFKFKYAKRCFASCWGSRWVVLRASERNASIRSASRIVYQCQRSLDRIVDLRIPWQPSRLLLSISNVHGIVLRSSPIIRPRFGNASTKAKQIDADTKPVTVNGRQLILPYKNYYPAIDKLHPSVYYQIFCTI